jgi:plasma kallikrein
VPFYLCKEDGNINSDGSMIIDARFDGNATVPTKTCPSLQCCCKKVNTIPETTVPANICEDGLKRAPLKCGYRNQKGLGGKVTSVRNKNSTLHSQYGEFPWMTAILVEQSVGTKTQRVYRAGGSLIHPKVVLTAAHIIGNNTEKLVARAGEWDTQTENEMCEHKDQKVEKVIIHEKFNNVNLQNDLVSL